MSSQIANIVWASALGNLAVSVAEVAGLATAISVFTAGLFRGIAGLTGADPERVDRLTHLGFFVGVVITIVVLISDTILSL